MFDLQIFLSQRREIHGCSPGTLDSLEDFANNAGDAPLSPNSHFTRNTEVIGSQGEGCAVDDDEILQAERNFAFALELDEDVMLEEDVKGELNMGNCSHVLEQGFCKEWVSMSGFLLLRPTLMRRAWEQHGPSSLFPLFLHRSFFESVRKWTAPVLRSRGLPDEFLTLCLLYGYIGLEIAM